MSYSSKLKWARFILCLAAIYNVFWGVVISIYPQIILFDDNPTNFTYIILRCIGMLVGVYGIAYYFSSRDPVKFWPLILVGFIGKVLGPLGALYYIVLGQITPRFFIVNVFNDLIWLFPFGWVLYQTLVNKLSVLKPQNNEKTLYQKFLGEEFEQLSPNLKEFHQSKKPVRALGEFRVTRGKNLMANVLANIAGLPGDFTSAEAELIVRPFPDKETWNRRIADKKVISKQWLENGFLVERFKIVRIYLTAQVTDGDLIIVDAASTIMWISMPPFFTPIVFATGKDIGDGIAIEVEIGFRPFGRIVNYSGIVKISQMI
jgi:hypothetical protein